eukprot:16060192-Heterocapsa_arctica.AAC.1
MIHHLVRVAHEGAYECLNEAVALLRGNPEHLVGQHEGGLCASSRLMGTERGKERYRVDEVGPHPPVGDRKVTPG